MSREARMQRKKSEVRWYKWRREVTEEVKEVKKLRTNRE